MSARIDAFWSQQGPLICLDCGASYHATLWMIVDGAARPDLLAHAGAGTLHEARCPNGHRTTCDLPLLIYDPAHTPCLLFSPAQSLTLEQNQQFAARLLDTLRARLGAAAPEDGGSAALLVVPRADLPAALSQRGAPAAPAGEIAPASEAAPSAPAIRLPADLPLPLPEAPATPPPEGKPDRRNAIIAWIYLAAVLLAESVTTLADPQVGLVLHCLILLTLVVHAALVEGGPAHALLLSLTLAPLIRILSLVLPLASFPLIYWFVFTSIPLFVASALIIRTLRFSRQDYALQGGTLPVQIGIALIGLPLGLAEYLILRPASLTPVLTLESIWWPALVLLVCTGFFEELIFRGILQHAARAVLGGATLVYGAALFAVLHIGYQSLLDVAFVFAVGLLFGALVARTRSLLGVTLAHGLTNILLFLVLPHLL